MTHRELIDIAITARNFSYSPYSSFAVGAALLCQNGKVYTGSNIENSSFSATICAERTAFANAVASGEKDFSAIAVVGGIGENTTEICTPCGICRQVMAEFCDKDFKIVLLNGDKTVAYTLNELLPLSFKSESLSKHE